MKDPRFNPHLLEVPLYIAGKSAAEVREALGLSEVIKLASNENPLGPSPKALQALRAALPEAHRYPGVAARELRQALARHHGHGLSEHHFLLANGGTDVLRVIAQSFVFDGGNTVMGEVSFPMYRILTTMFGGKPVQVPPRPDLSLDLDAMARAITADTRVVWLCSPNNPTGFVLSQQQADDFLRRVPQEVVVVFDESYLDFAEDPQCVKSLEYIRQGRNVVAVRSFSKTTGLANLRVGYAIARPELIEYMSHAVLPFHTGALVLRAAMAGLGDEDYRRRSRELILRERAFLFGGIKELGLKCFPSQANFILVAEVPGGGQAFAERLLQRGIIVRPMAAFGKPDGFRVSVGRRGENERFLEALGLVLAESKEEQR